MFLFTGVNNISLKCLGEPEAPCPTFPLSEATHPGLGQLLDHLDFLIRDEVVETHNPGPVPLVLLFHRPQDIARVPVVVVVTAEQLLLSARRLEREREGYTYKYKSTIPNSR